MKSSNLQNEICVKSFPPNTEFFLVRIFLYSVRIQENTDQKKTPYLGTFHAVLCRQFPVCFSKFCCEE